MTKQKSVPLSVGIRRILKLADYVEKIPRGRFDFERFVGEDWTGDPKLSCGTTACALGWATTMPLFKKLGLRLHRDGSSIALGRWSNWGHVTRSVFGISETAMNALFIPSYGYITTGDYPTLDEDATPKQWAKHARRMVKILQDEAS